MASESVRELRNIMARATVLAEGSCIAETELATRWRATLELRLLDQQHDRLSVAEAQRRDAAFGLTFRHRVEQRDEDARRARRTRRSGGPYVNFPDEKTAA